MTTFAYSLLELITAHHDVDVAEEREKRKGKEGKNCKVQSSDICKHTSRPRPVHVALLALDILSMLYPLYPSPDLVVERHRSNGNEDGDHEDAVSKPLD